MSADSTEVPNVLVVEDEMLLRMRAVDIVEDAGFRSVEAVNADEALSILESRSDISLLFTDIQMPGSMDGLKLAHAVHDRWPSIKIILVSGQVKPSDAERPADSRFFGKPLAVEQMIAELQAMVGAGALKIVPSPAMSSADETSRITTSIDPSPRSIQRSRKCSAGRRRAGTSSAPRRRTSNSVAKRSGPGRRWRYFSIPPIVTRLFSRTRTSSGSTAARIPILPSGWVSITASGLIWHGLKCGRC
jgi:CheY-like chemotaxis protein